MTILTKPTFYYIDSISGDNQYINFLEPNGLNVELSVTVPVGDYSMTALASAVESAMNAQGENTYTVTLDRSTRKYTIASDDIVDLLVTTGTNVGQSIWTTIGFTTERDDVTSAEADTLSGYQYTPQFPLQDYEDSVNNKARISPSRTESASGVEEVFSYGTNRFFKWNITLITNRDVGDFSVWIENDQLGVDNARAFMEAITEKIDFEFMPDRTDVNTFSTIRLERTPESRIGVDYKLKELLNRGLVGYYETGKLIFRDVS